MCSRLKPKRLCITKYTILSFSPMLSLILISDTIRRNRSLELVRLSMIFAMIENYPRNAGNPRFEVGDCPDCPGNDGIDYDFRRTIHEALLRSRPERDWSRQPKSPRWLRYRSRWQDRRRGLA